MGLIQQALVILALIPTGIMLAAIFQVWVKSIVEVGEWD